MDARQEARRLYQEEHLSPTEIAQRLDISPGTVRSWKARDNWGAATQRRNAATGKAQPCRQAAVPDIPLTEAQKLFCEIFVRNRNATMAYRQSHPDAKYTTCMTQGCESLKRPNIRAYIDQLRDLKAEAVRLAPVDLVEKYMRIAFADMSDFVTWGFDGNDNRLAAMPSELVDGSLVCEVSRSDKGFKIKLEDRQKALDWLAGWFNMNPMDKHRIDYENRKLAIEEKKLNGNPEGLTAAAAQIQAIADLINVPAPSRDINAFMPGGASDDSLRTADDKSD